MAEGGEFFFSNGRQSLKICVLWNIYWRTLHCNFFYTVIFHLQTTNSYFTAMSMVTFCSERIWKEGYYTDFQAFFHFICFKKKEKQL